MPREAAYAHASLSTPFAPPEIMCVGLKPLCSTAASTVAGSFIPLLPQINTFILYSFDLEFRGCRQPLFSACLKKSD